MTTITTLDRVKTALRVTTDAFNDEIGMLIRAAQLDLNIAGADFIEESDPLVLQAIICYCKWRFGTPENPEMMQQIYEMQKAQLRTATGYTDWGSL